MEQAIPFLKGLLSSCHLKCKKSGFIRSLDEAKMYDYLYFFLNISANSNKVEENFIHAI